MVSALEWVLVGVVLYAVVVMALRARGHLPDYVKGGGPIVTLHTRRGKRFLDWLARPKRIWRAWGNFGIGISLVVMVGSLAFVLFAVYATITNPPPASALYEPRNIVVIPGVNEFLPLSVAPEIITGLAIALVVHEGGHGLFCRVGDIDVDTMGLVFLSFIPMGAFVQPDEESVVKANRGAQTRMFVAGVTNNFAIGFLALALLFGPVIASISVVGGVPIGDSLPGGPADEADIDSGTVIESVAGNPVANASELQAALDDADPTVQIGLRDGGETTLERRVLVNGAAPGSPVEKNQTITGVNGTDVRTVGAFYDEIRNRTVVSLSRANASDVRTAIGAYGRVRENGSLSAAGATVGEVAFITSVDGQRTHHFTALENALANASAGDTVDLVAYENGSRETYAVELSEGDTVGERLGVVPARGISGFGVTDLGIEEYPASLFYTILGGNGVGSLLGFFQRALTIIILPLAGIAGLYAYNFPGFTGIATNFYAVDGPLAILGTGGVFVLANVLYWTAWVNLLVGQFNLLPSYPLDGGHVVRTTTEAIVARLPVSDGRRVTTTVALALSAAMIGSFILLFAAPWVLN